MSYEISIPRKGVSTSALVMLVVTLLTLALGFPNAAMAAAPAVDPSCSNLKNYGFTAGVVYCVIATIGTAVNQYVTALQTALSAYEGAALMVAIALYGVKLMTSGIEQPIKQTMSLVFRIMIGLFCFHEAPYIYKILAGDITQTNPGGIINEAIGWVTGTTGSGGTNLFGNLISTQCPTPPTPPGGGSGYGGFQVWQAFDCMFMKIFGVANPATNSAAFATSMLIIIAAALLSGTLGITVATLGITVFFAALKLVTKALFLVLIAYLTIGFLTIFAPLIAPLIFFESKYLSEKFRQWLGFIISTAVQPVFVLGFLALAISVDDQIIEGTFPGGVGGCNPPQYPSTTSTIAAEPVQGYGQNGTGVCSFTQLTYNGNSGNLTTNATLSGFFAQFMEQNQPLFDQAISGSPQGASQNGNYVVPTVTQSYAMPNVVGPASQISEPASTVGVNATHLKTHAPLKQMMLTLLTFVFSTWCMIQLMDIIPDMAKSMTIGVGINLYRALQAPFEGLVSSTLNGAEQGAKKNVAGTGLLNGNLQGVPGLFTGGVPGALTGALKGMGTYMRRSI